MRQRLGERRTSSRGSVWISLKRDSQHRRLPYWLELSVMLQSLMISSEMGFCKGWTFCARVAMCLFEPGVYAQSHVTGFVLFFG